MDARSSFILLSIFITSRFGIVSTCLFFINRCLTHCPRNTHPYHTKCDGETLSQRTCLEPAQYLIGFTCGWSRCDCNGDLLLEESTGACVDLLTCKMNIQDRHRHRRRRPRKPRIGRLSKKLRFKPDDEANDADVI